VLPGINIGEGAVLGLGAVATRDLEPWAVYAGSPAVKVKERARHGVSHPEVSGA
jgi:putative colanic acid biosynthesis acetyltransferase WcaF